MKESSVESYFTSRIKALGGESRKVKWIGRRGAPDQLPLLAGMGPTLVELKAPGKKPRPEQLREHERLRRAGYRVLVIDTHELVDKYFPLGEQHAET